MRQLLGVESANYTPSFKMFKDMFRWNRFLKKGIKPKILKMIQKDNMVGSTRETTSAILSQLKKDGFIKKGIKMSINADKVEQVLEEI